MGLNGSLEEFSIQDILQILALGQKTGHLSLDTPAGAGGIVFRAGRVIASFDGGCSSPETSLASWSECPRDAVLRRRIVASLARLARARQGEFHFQVSADPPQRIQGRDLARRDAPPQGIDIVELLLEMAWRQDEDASDSSVRPVRTAGSSGRGSSRSSSSTTKTWFGGSSPATSSRAVTAWSRRVTWIGGGAGGQSGRGGGSLRSCRRPQHAGLGRDSFRGGFEVVKRLAKLRLRPPVVMMADGAVWSLDAKPMRGVWSLV